MQNMFYICASIGALATMMSLIYLFVKDFRNSRQISDLTKVALTLKKDLELKYQPHLWINGVKLRKEENSVSFDLNNKREWCKLLKFNIISGDLRFDEQNFHLPYELEPKFSDEIISDTTRRWVYCLNNSVKDLDEVVYEFEIIFEDRIGVGYSVKVKGEGNICKVGTPFKLI